MSLHDALVKVVTDHITTLLSEQTLIDTVLSTLNTDDKLFWYLGKEKKIKKLLLSYNTGDTLKLKKVLEEQYNEDSKNKNNK